MLTLRGIGLHSLVQDLRDQLDIFYRISLYKNLFKMQERYMKEALGADENFDIKTANFGEE